MELTKEQQKGQVFLSKIYKKAWRNSEFKEELVNNPIKTLNNILGSKANFPSNKKLIVEDQSNPNFIYINIPVKQNFEDMELTDDQLEVISGGEGIVALTLGAIAVWGVLEHTGVIDTVDWL